MDVLVVYITKDNKREQDIIRNTDSVDSAIDKVQEIDPNFDILAYAEEIK